MKKSVLTTGLSGLVGSKLETDFADRYEFTNLDISNQENPTDITDYNQVLAAFKANQSDFVVHFAAFTNVSAAWEQNNDKNGIAYKVNVLGTENIVNACLETNKHLVHISTAYVFDGDKKGLYTEDDTPNPIEWYGKTKALAEEVVSSSKIDWTILRIDVPFRSDSFPRLDLIRKSLELVEKGIPLFDNHFIGPTFIDDFAKVIDWVLRTKTTGLFHANNGEQWSDFQLIQKVIEIFNLDLDIKAGNLDQYLKKLERPYQRNTAMSNQKLIKVLDFKLHTIEEALHLLKL